MSWRAWPRWEATRLLVWLRTEATASSASSATAPTPTKRNAANSRHPSGPSTRAPGLAMITRQPRLRTRRVGASDLRPGTPAPAAGPGCGGLIAVEEAVTVAASVLVVEDERKIRDLLRSYLEHDGLTVITTGSGAEAISWPATPPPT
jgi:hypothetical protein